MITADAIKQGAWLSSNHIEGLLRKSYPKDVILSAKFLGISNGGQFCYEVGYPDAESKGGFMLVKVYVWQDHNGEMTADY